MPKNKSIAVMPLIILLTCVAVILINPEVNFQTTLAALAASLILFVLLLIEIKQNIKP